MVDSWLISSGRPATPTDPGHYRINSHIDIQTMRGFNPDGTPYTQPDVKWVMYFNGDQGFHGVYWHDNWGHTMSHGCVGCRKTSPSASTTGLPPASTSGSTTEPCRTLISPDPASSWGSTSARPP